jgi:hypothetical protein
MNLPRRRATNGHRGPRSLSPNGRDSVSRLGAAPARLTCMTRAKRLGTGIAWEARCGFPSLPDVPMSCRTVPQKINDFVVRRQGRIFCDTCIQEGLGLKWRQQVQLITATLAVTEAFRRDLGCCCACNEVKQVIQAVATQQTQEIHQTGERALTRLLAAAVKPPVAATSADWH